jgi:hypothetical protein
MQIRNPDSICYTRSAWDTPPDIQTENLLPLPKQPPLPPRSPCEIHTPGKFGRPPPSPNTNRPNTPISSANEFAAYIANNYPHIVCKDWSFKYHWPNLFLIAHRTLSKRVAPLFFLTCSPQVSWGYFSRDIMPLGYTKLPFWRTAYYKRTPSSLMDSWQF